MQGSPTGYAFHQEVGLMYIRLEDPEVLSSVEHVYSTVGHIRSTIAQGVFDQDALEEADADRTVVRKCIAYCRGKTIFKLYSRGSRVI